MLQSKGVIVMLAKNVLVKGQGPYRFILFLWNDFLNPVNFCSNTIRIVATGIEIPLRK